MKIIYFNIHHCDDDKIGILNFLNFHKPNTDIFCLQEVAGVSESILDEQLDNYNKITSVKKVESDNFEIVTYIKNIHTILESDILFKDDPLASTGIYMRFNHLDKEINILNYHGNARPGNKLDTPKRLAESQGIIDYFTDKTGIHIIGGDFNLDPNTKSVNKFNTAKYTNLIEKYKIKTTRNEMVWKNFPESKQYFSDYIFVKGNIEILNFEVPYSEISDHLPLIMEFN